MDNIWQEMAEAMMAKDPSLFEHNVSPEDIAAAMSDAWGKDRAAAVWTLEDVMERAEEIELVIDKDEARAILNDLVDSLSGYDGFDALDSTLNNFAEHRGDFDYDEDDDDTDY